MYVFFVQELVADRTHRRLTSYLLDLQTSVSPDVTRRHELLFQPSDFVLSYRLLLKTAWTSVCI